MNFNKVLFPEIILGKRGDKDVRDMYKMLLGTIDIQPSGVSITHEGVNDLCSKDVNFFRHLFISKHCMSNNAKAYHVGSGFLDALSSIDRDLPIDMLPAEFSGFISFSPNKLADDDGFVEGAFVYIGTKGSQLFKKEHEAFGKRCLFITYINNYIPGFGYQSGNLAVCLEDFEKVNEALTGFKTIDSKAGESWEPDSDTVSLRHKVFRTIINTVLYIYSEDPKIERVHPFIKGGVSKNELRRSGRVINECTIPVTFVHRLYAPTRVYTADSSFVESYPRWQRCGVGLCSIKLVWVKEHTRTYSKVEVLNECE